MKQDILLTRFAVVASTVALALGFANVFTSIDLGADGLSIKVMLVIVFSIATLSLFYGNIVYQLTRIGQLKRHLNHLNCRDEHRNLETLYEVSDSPTVSILVPSFKEEIPVVMQTIVSAALSEYPNRRVTLLLDDPPARKGADLVTVSATRELIVELNDTLAAAAERFRVAARTYLERASSGTTVISRERQIVGALFDDAAAVVEAIGRRYVELSQPAFAHADELFAREVIDRLVPISGHWYELCKSSHPPPTARWDSPTVRPASRMQNITGRSVPKRLCTAWALSNSGLMSPVGPEVAAYERHTPVGLITRGWGPGDRTRPKNSTRNNVEQTWPRFRVVWSIRRESVHY